MYERCGAAEYVNEMKGGVCGNELLERYIMKGRVNIRLRESLVELNLCRSSPNALNCFFLL